MTSPCTWVRPEAVYLKIILYPASSLTCILTYALPPPRVFTVSFCSPNKWTRSSVSIFWKYTTTSSSGPPLFSSVTRMKILVVEKNDETQETTDGTSATIPAPTAPSPATRTTIHHGLLSTWKPNQRPNLPLLAGALSGFGAAPVGAGWGLIGSSGMRVAVCWLRTAGKYIAAGERPLHARSTGITLYMHSALPTSRCTAPHS